MEKNTLTFNKNPLKVDRPTPRSLKVRPDTYLRILVKRSIVQGQINTNRYVQGRLIFPITSLHSDNLPKSQQWTALQMKLITTNNPQYVMHFNRFFTTAVISSCQFWQVAITVSTKQELPRKWTAHTQHLPISPHYCLEKVTILSNNITPPL